MFKFLVPIEYLFLYGYGGDTLVSQWSSLEVSEERLLGLALGAPVTECVTLYCLVRLWLGRDYSNIWRVRRWMIIMSFGMNT
ncbi:hypothetical protein Mapa_009822 [Marchantia paleacea]|nr:hypothetical protein Mapa_009822 [Marchantia paleacea]